MVMIGKEVISIVILSVHLGNRAISSVIRPKITKLSPIGAVTRRLVHIG